MRKLFRKLLLKLTLSTCLKVYALQISFNDKDLLLRSKLYKHYFFIKRYINKKMVNCILMDNDWIINILALRIIKELEIYIYVYI